MGRGRRPNLALEPTRALQTQRAFRQRKAEHLASLEDAVKQLSEENAKLSKLLHMEPSSSKLPHLGSPTSRSASPSTSASTNTAAAGVPIAPARATPSTPASTSGDPISGAATGCDNCAPIAETNRQLAIAAAQVEAQMRGLQQSIKALRSVLVHHGIPIPSPLGASTGSTESSLDDTRQHKRSRVAEHSHPQLPPLSSAALPPPSSLTPSGQAADASDPSGIHMTSNYYYSHSSSANPDVYRRSNPAGGAGGSTWHTPSPSAILSAPTPPSASFSPRQHSYNGTTAGGSSANVYHAASPASTSTNGINSNGEDSIYHYKRMPSRQNSNGSSSRLPPQLPPPMSPAKLQHQHQSQSNGALPPWSTSASTSTASSTVQSPRSHSFYPSEREAGYSRPSATYPDQHHQQQHQQRHEYSQQQRAGGGAAGGSYGTMVSSPSAVGGIAGASPSYVQSHHSPYDSGVNSPRTSQRGVVHSPRNYPPHQYAEDAGGSGEGYSGGRTVASSYNIHHRTNAAEPANDTRTTTSSSSKCGGSGSKQNCNEPNVKQNDESSSKKSCCPPKPSAATAASTWSAPEPLGISFDMRMSNKYNSTHRNSNNGDDGQDSKRSHKPDHIGSEKEEKEEEEEEECCLGLVKCDSEGRIII